MTQDEIRKHLETLRVPKSQEEIEMEEQVESLETPMYSQTEKDVSGILGTALGSIGAAGFRGLGDEARARSFQQEAQQAGGLFAQKEAERQGLRDKLQARIGKKRKDRLSEGLKLTEEGRKEAKEARAMAAEGRAKAEEGRKDIRLGLDQDKFKLSQARQEMDKDRIAMERERLDLSKVQSQRDQQKLDMKMQEFRENRSPIAKELVSSINNKLKNLGPEYSKIDVSGMSNQDLKAFVDSLPPAKKEKAEGSINTAMNTAAEKLRKEYNALDTVKDYGKLRGSLARLDASQDTPAGDIALIFNYMKMLDPGSVVREGEFATAQNAGSVGDNIINLYNKVITGERLNPKQRDMFKGQAKDIMKKYEDTQVKPLRDRYEFLAKETGVRPDLVIAPSQPKTETKKSSDPRTRLMELRKLKMDRTKSDRRRRYEELMKKRGG